MTIHPNRPLSQELCQCLAHAGLPALMTMARIHGSPSKRALAGIRGIRDHILQVDVDLNSLPSLQPEAMASAVIGCDQDPEWRERILRGMTLVAMFDGSPSPEALALLDLTATAFQVDARPVNTYRNVMEGHQLALRFDILRRGFIRQAVEATIQADGLSALAATLKVLSGHEDRAMLERFQALRGYPSGSFGKAYADFIDLNAFDFPGQPGGPPPPVFRHDCCHVLGGYGTTAAEEGGVVAFQAGFEGLDPFDVIMFVMAEFELGVGVSPFIPGEWRQLDPDRLFAGLEHGSHVSCNLIKEMDPWTHFADSINVVRERFSIPARGRKPEYLK
ncbi:MAG: TerB family tellurite resistance protein [Synechococcus sp. ChSW.bin.154]